MWSLFRYCSHLVPYENVGYTGSFRYMSWLYAAMLEFGSQTPHHQRSTSLHAEMAATIAGSALDSSYRK